MANKSKRPERFDLNAAGRRRNVIIQVALVATVLIFAVGLVGYIVLKKPPTGDRAVRVAATEKLVKNDAGEPKAVVTFYEDFLCPACGNFERAFGPTVSKLIDIGAIAADYHMVAILDSKSTDHYSSRAGAAAYCVADADNDAFRRFHTALFTKQIQPEEVGGDYLNNARLTELARQAGVVGGVPDCISSGKYTKMVSGMAKDAGIRSTPTIRINGTDWRPSTPEALVAKIKEIVGDIPGLDTAAVAPQAS